MATKQFVSEQTRALTDQLREQEASAAEDLLGEYHTLEMVVDWVMEHPEDLAHLREAWPTIAAALARLRMAYTAAQRDRIETLDARRDGDTFVSMAEAAREAGVTRQAFHTWARRHVVPTVARLEGGKPVRYVFRRDLDAYLDRRGTR